MYAESFGARLVELTPVSLSARPRHVSYRVGQSTWYASGMGRSELAFFVPFDLTRLDRQAAFRPRSNSRRGSDASYVRLIQSIKKSLVGVRRRESTCGRPVVKLVSTEVGDFLHCFYAASLPRSNTLPGICRPEGPVNKNGERGCQPAVSRGRQRAFQSRGTLMGQ